MNSQPWTTAPSRLIVLQHKAPEKSEGGIILPQNSKERPAIGDVVVVGEDVLIARVGDEVMFPKYSGVTVEIDGDDHLVLSQDDILAVRKKVAK